MTGRSDHVDLATVPVEGDGVQWTLEGSDDLNANLVHLEPGHAIEAHVNGEVDVVIVGVAGAGTLHVDDGDIAVAAAVVAHVPRGTNRRVEAGQEGLSYLTVHRRRGPLRIGAARRG